MRTYPFVWVDVFADRPFAGNALCVFLDGSGLSDEEMQALAKETNLSETTFVLPPTRPGATYRTRIFTPGGELAFAGHPTLGTAAALALSGKVEGTQLVQESLSGLTPLELGYVGPFLDRVTMEAPPPVFVEAVAPERAAPCLGLEAADLSLGGHAPEVIFAGVKHLIIPVASAKTLAGLKPNYAAITELSRSLGCIGAYPFALLEPDTGAHARARLYAPLFGIPEDAATGSAAAPLGAYMHRHGLLPADRSDFWYEQGIEMHRPSRLWVDVQEEAGALRVKVGGQVRLVGQGEFSI